MQSCHFPDEHRPFFSRHPWLAWTLILVGLGLFALASYSLLTERLLWPYDRFMAERLEPIHAAMPAWLVRALTDFANISSLGPTLLVFYLSYRWLRRKCDDRFLMLVMSYGLGLLWFWLLSLVFNRERPDLPGLLARFPFPSFPSGHMIQTITLLVPLLYLGLPRLHSRRFRSIILLAALLYTLLIAFDRLILNAHYFTDVLAGAAVGLFWSVIVVMGFERYHLRRAANHPNPSGESDSLEPSGFSRRRQPG